MEIALFEPAVFVAGGLGEVLVAVSSVMAGVAVWGAGFLTTCFAGVAFAAAGLV
jgi:hypothetical protein